MPITNAQLIRRLSLIAHDLSEEVSELSEGMWNPAYAGADGTERADRTVQGLRLAADALERQKN